MTSICGIIAERRELLVMKDTTEESLDESASGILSSLRKFFGFR
jgi:hypothetical protein